MPLFMIPAMLLMAPAPNQPVMSASAAFVIRPLDSYPKNLTLPFRVKARFRIESTSIMKGSGSTYSFEQVWTDPLSPVYLVANKPLLLNPGYIGSKDGASFKFVPLKITIKDAKGTEILTLGGTEAGPLTTTNRPLKRLSYILTLEYNEQEDLSIEQTIDKAVE